MTSDTKAPDLLPCPFCGEEPSLRDDPHIPEAAKIGCLKVGCFGYDHWDPNKSVAVSRWNARADMAVEVKPLEWSGDELGLFGTNSVCFSESYTTTMLIWLNSDGQFSLTRNEMPMGAYPTLDEAKAAAEADYERRILRSLKTRPIAEIEAAAFRRGAEQMRERAAWSAQHRYREWNDLSSVECDYTACLDVAAAIRALPLTEEDKA